MPDERDEQKTFKKRFSDKLYITEFGRYEGDRSAEYPDNRILVGREKQRSKLLQLLFNRGRKGVYLITGYRGAGKTSFVQYCVNEFRDNVYERFLNSQVGRVFFLDQIMFVLFAFIVITASLLLSQLSGEIIVHTFSIKYAYRWLLAFPFFLFNMIWFLFAKSLFDISLRPSASAIKGKWRYKWKSFIALVLAIYSKPN